MAEIQKITLPASQAKVSEENEKKYGHIDIKSIQFKETWVIWESLKQQTADKNAQSNNFLDNNFAIFDFSDMESLAKIWRTRIRNVSQFFTFDGNSWRFLHEKKMRSTEAICIFKKGIMPAWEDPKNSRGGEVQVMFESVDQNPEAIDNIFKDVLSIILCENYSFYNETNGFRIVDKARDGKAKIRLEIWFNFCDDKSEATTKKIAELNTIFTEVIKKHQQNVDLSYKNHTH
ncbi:hypothetical protein ABPG72_006335 [Tetrahymena utriculariae]